MRDYDRQGKNKITYQDFHEIGISSVFYFVNDSSQMNELFI